MQKKKKKLLKLVDMYAPVDRSHHSSSAEVDLPIGWGSTPA